MDLNLTKSPAECASKDDVRYAIDTIDRAVMELFALRFKYVEAIVKFKNDPDEVVAQERKDMVLNMRAQWANELGLDPDTFVEIYRLLIDSNIKKEMDIFKNRLP